jgi:K+-sensing histidine kinase KdpD
LANSERSAGRYLGAIAVVLASTAISEALYRVLGTTRVSMIFLAGVLIAAVRWGSGPAYLSAIAAFVVYNFYLVEPRFTLQFASAEDVLVLIVFFAVAVLTGNLAGRVRDEAARAAERARTTDALLQASQEFSSSAQEAVIGQRLEQHIASAVHGDAIVWDADWRRFGESGAHSSARAVEDEAMMAARRALRDGGDVEQRPGSWRARPLRTAGDTLGVAAWRGETSSEAGPEVQRLLNVLVDLGAAAIGRAKLAARQAEIDARARTEQLRDALLSSISHDLRTPLSSILASASSLREFGDEFSAATRDDLVLTIQEEAERLNAFVANLLNMTKLQSGALHIEATDVSVAEVVDRVVDRFSRRGAASRLRKRVAANLSVRGDAVLVEQALSNVVENALRYSPISASVIIAAEAAGRFVVIEVLDEGPGVPESELELIFEKFYRSPNTSATLQGTGLGLSISKGLVEAMGGVATARLREDASGMCVSLIVPRAGK